MKMRPCPICDLADGFHDQRLHRERVQVPRELLKPSGWQRGETKE